MTEWETTNKRDSRDTALTILRIVLWLSPAVLILFSFVFFSFFGRFLFVFGGMLFPILAVLIGTALIGYFDQRISLMLKKIPPPYEKGELTRWTIIFVLAQIIMAPTICFIVLYGVCMINKLNF